MVNGLEKTKKTLASPIEPIARPNRARCQVHRICCGRARCHCPCVWISPASASSCRWSSQTRSRSSSSCVWISPASASSRRQSSRTRLDQPPWWPGYPCTGSGRPKGRRRRSWTGPACIYRGESEGVEEREMRSEGNLPELGEARRRGWGMAAAALVEPDLVEAPPGEPPSAS